MAAKVAARARELLSDWGAGGGQTIIEINLGYPKSSFLTGFRPLIFNFSPLGLFDEKTKKIAAGQALLLS